MKLFRGVVLIRVCTFKNVKCIVYSYFTTIKFYEYCTELVSPFKTFRETPNTFYVSESPRVLNFIKRINEFISTLYTI